MQDKVLLSSIIEVCFARLQRVGKYPPQRYLIPPARVFNTVPNAFKAAPDADEYRPGRPFCRPQRYLIPSATPFPRLFAVLNTVPDGANTEKDRVGGLFGAIGSVSPFALLLARPCYPETSPGQVAVRILQLLARPFQGDKIGRAALLYYLQRLVILKESCPYWFKSCEADLNPE